MGAILMTTKSKGIREIQKERAKEIIRLKNEGKSYTEIASNLVMDRSNVRRTYLNATASEKTIN